MTEPWLWTPPPDRSRRGRVRRGASTGLALGACYAAYVTILKMAVGDEPFTRLGLTYARTVLLYLVGGALTGALIGLLDDLRRTRAGRLALGVFIAAPGLVVVMLHAPSREDMPALEPSTTYFWIIWLVCTLVMGSLLGLFVIDAKQVEETPTTDGGNAAA